MAEQHASLDSQLAARFGSALRSVGTRLLTVDTTVRSIVLTGGGWRLFGSATQVYIAVRIATNASGNLATGETAPTTTTLAAAAAGSPAAGAAWDSAQTVTDLRVPTDISKYVEIPVKGQAFVVLYVRVASGTATPVLEGPFELPA
jgi:hypothetical protein